MHKNNIPLHEYQIQSLEIKQMSTTLNAIKGEKKSHKGYINVTINNKNKIALIDSGNSIHFDVCMRTDLAKELKLKIIKRKINVGSASVDHEMKVKVITSFKMILNINSITVTFFVNSWVIDDLNDQLNIGSSFLKEHKISLKFANDKPLTLHFKKFGIMESVGSLTSDNICSNEKSNENKTSSENIMMNDFIYSEEETNFENLQGKLFKLKVTKNQFFPQTLLVK